MQVYKMSPVLREYIWGGKKLKSEWNKHAATATVAESWEFSAYEGAESVVAEGEEKGTSLLTLYRTRPELFGNRAFRAPMFPVLIKLIDAASDLSVQVHPSDAYALREEGQLGKTEMWYIADAEEGAAIYYGFSRDVTPEEFRKAIDDNTVTDLLNRVPVRKGDCFFVEAGTLHAILGGVTVIEVQENSNLTYRVYDYARRDASGNLRPLHVEKAIAVADYRKSEARPVSHPVVRIGDADVRLLADCAYFSVSEWVLDGAATLTTTDSFASLTVAEGSGSIAGQPVQKGDTFFLPAHGSYVAEGKFSWIYTTV